MVDVTSPFTLKTPQSAQGVSKSPLVTLSTRKRDSSYRHFCDIGIPCLAASFACYKRGKCVPRLGLRERGFPMQAAFKTKTSSFAGSFGILALLFVTAPAPAYAQQFPRWEVFTGFSYAHVNLGQQTGTFQPTDKNYYGLHVNGSFNPRSYLRVILCDFSVQIGGTTAANLSPEKADVRTSQVLFGPEFVRRSKRSAVFAHALIGVTSTRLVGTIGGVDVIPDIANRTNLAFGVGGGVDFPLTHLFTLRAIQADYIPTRLSGSWESDFRAATGIVFTFDYRKAR
jgi:opacity protein-like surface antigen